MDEYLHLSENNKVSFHYFMQKHLFKNIGLKKRNIHFPSTKKPSNYDRIIKKSGGLDLTILGIGINGHIAFNEPGSKINSRTRIVKLTNETIKSNSRFFKNRKTPNKSLSIGISTILKSKKIILIATGKNKAEIISEVIKTKPSSKIPATFLKKHKRVIFLLDKEAAAKLKI